VGSYGEKGSGTRSSCFALLCLVSHQSGVRESGVVCAWHTKAGPTAGAGVWLSEAPGKSGPVCFLVGPVGGNRKAGNTIPPRGGGAHSFFGV